MTLFEIFERDTFQNVTRYVDRIGRVERMTYNEFGDVLTKEVGLLAGELHDASQDTQTDEYAIMSKTYYPAGHQNQHLLATEVDANGNTMKYLYNKFNLLVEIQEPDDEGTGFHTKASYTYDRGRRITSSTDALGRVTQYFYDRRDRVVLTQYFDGSQNLFSMELMIKQNLVVMKKTVWYTLSMI